jgi:hypothetical protein
MSAVGISAIAFGCCFGAGFIGLFLRHVIPSEHFDSDTKNTVKLAMGLIAAMAVLALGLLIASAKSSYDAQRTRLEQLASDIIELNQRLAAFGPETKDSRQAMRIAMVGLHDRIWSSEGVNTVAIDPRATAQLYDSVLGAIRVLQAKAADAQRSDQKAALDLAGTLFRTRLMMFVEGTSQISTSLLVTLVLWVSAPFLGFGLVVRFNPTVAASIFVGAVCVAAAIFLILELNTPFSGLIRLSDAPVRYAISRVGE